MDRYDNGEGIECATLDAALLHYADTCYQFRNAVRQWKRAVFRGRSEYDPVFNRSLRCVGNRLRARAAEMLRLGQQFDGKCDPLQGQTKLQNAVRDLDKLLTGWVTPKLAVSPAPRRWSMPDSGSTDESRRAIAALPPLPADWEPDDPDQQARFRELKKS